MSVVTYKLFESKPINTTINIITLLFVLYISCVSIYAIVKIEKLENELNRTKEVVNILNSYLNDAEGTIDEYDELDNYDDFNDYQNYIDDEDEDKNEDATTSDPNVDRTLSHDVEHIFLGFDDENTRKKREVLAATRDGVLIKSESYAEFKKLNMSKKSHPKNLTPSILRTTLMRSGEIKMKTTPKPPPVMNRKSRVMKIGKSTQHGFKKPLLKTFGDEQNVAGRLKIVRHKRENDHLPILRYHSSRQDSSEPKMYVAPYNNNNNNNRMIIRRRFEENPLRLSKIRPQPAIHFSGDTSKYVLGQHHNYKGNGHLKHRSKTFVDWKPENWVKSLGMDNHFTIQDGKVTIKESGLYFVYAQIYYLDEHDTNGFHVIKNNEVLLQCTTMTHSNERVMKGNTCYTGSVAYLSEGDNVEVKDISDARYSLFEPGKSFFGIVKLGDIKLTKN